MILAHVLQRSLTLALIGVGILGSAAVTIGQGVLDPEAITFERIVGGGFLGLVAVLIVRWSYRMVGVAKEMFEAERQAWREDREVLRDERDQLRQELLETHALLREERNLRISLERAGITDRRSNGENTSDGD